MRRRVDMRLPPDLVEEADELCAERGITRTALVEDLLRRALAKWRAG